jgi:arginyl-tRNA synthetase
MSATIQAKSMSTFGTADLEKLLVALGLKTPIPHFQLAEVLDNPLDVARSYLADSLSACAECDPRITYNAIQWPNNIYNGDLSVILPKMKPGADPDELAFDLMKKVRSSSS